MDWGIIHWRWSHAHIDTDPSWRVTRSRDVLKIRGNDYEWPNSNAWLDVVIGNPF